MLAEFGETLVFCQTDADCPYEWSTGVRVPITAVLIGPQPVDGDGYLRESLAALKVTVVDATGPAATARIVASASTTGRIALIDRRFVGHRHALRLALADPRWPVLHAPGILTVSGPARESLAARLRAIPDLTGHRVEGGSPAAQLTAPRPLGADTLATALADEDGIPVREVTLPDGLIAKLITEPLSARKDGYAEVAATDDEAIRLRRAVKNDDGLFTTLCVSSYSRYLARWCARRGLTPNVVTTLSLLIALAGAGAAISGTRPGYIIAALALYFSFVLDCVDGQLARYSLTFSRIGSWLDATFDRVKEYAVFAGLAIGSTRHGHNVWLLACLAMALQTIRHHVDFAFHEGQRTEAATETSSSTKVTAAPPPPVKTPVYWAKKAVILPIGERWAMIAILTAIFTPKVTFLALLIWGVFALAYITAGRVARSIRQSAPRSSAALDALAAMCDSIGVPRSLLRHPLAWLVPPTVQGLSYLVFILVAQFHAHATLPAMFGLLGAIIYHQYDIVYRIRAGAGAPPSRLTLALLTQPGRFVLVLILLFALSGGSCTLAIALLAGYLGLVALVESVRFWTRPAAPALPADAA
jgi:phosphatidylglycerophosphate synthase